ncbi:hypothetical protein OG444_40155 (plasmid) [Streptomyces sp. NBC_01232]|uniref:hypothetical protein n=1 Tax=Streptomyces sp. NBC_01232 TaxID=2903786 RepID=UPI002E116654|nr:hypothetical protein OG444_40155 [Streptomyces sp. NBC_01232]
MPALNSSIPPRRSWPYVVAAIVVLAVRQGWEAEQVITLAVCLLVLIALVSSASPGGE